MLDFYLIDDLQAKPNYPDPKDLKFVGGLDNQTFKRLKDKKIIADRFDYYSDFRWDTTLIKQISKTIHHHFYYRGHPFTNPVIGPDIFHCDPSQAKKKPWSGDYRVDI